MRRRRRRLAELVRSTVALTLDDGTLVAGVLLGEYDDVVALARARYASEAGAGFVGMDGEVLVPWGRVRIVQAGVTIDDTRALLQLARGEAG